MNTKRLGLFIVGILALVFALSAVSATTIFSDNFNVVGLSGWTSTNWSNTAGTFAESTNLPSATLSRTISTSGFNTIVVKYDRQLGADWETTDNFTASWSLDGVTFTPLESVVGSASDALPDDASFVSKTFSLPSSTNNNTGFRIKFECNTNAVSEFCRVDNVAIEGILTSSTPSEVTACTAVGNTGDLSVKRISFTNNGLSGSSPATFGKDDEWFPRENVNVEIQIKNNGNVNGDRVNNIEVNWGLYNTQTNEWVIETIDEKDFDLKDGKTNTMTVSFNLDKDLDVDLSDLTDGSDYKFYVTAQGDVDDGNDTATCVSDFEPASMVLESDFVVLDNINVPATVQCGQVVEVSADAWNVGDNDQDEVSVDVVGREKALGLSDNVLVGSVDAFDSKPFSYSFTVPKNLEEKTYGLTFQVKDENFDEFQNDFSDDYSEFLVPLVVKGNCGAAGAGTASVSATLVSGGVAGQALVVKATITNNEAQMKTYTIASAGFSEWASSASADQSTLVLNPGQSREVTITIDVKKEVSGEQTFFIEATSGSEVTRQPVLVNIKPKSAFGSLGNVFSGGNAAIWGIGLLNLILVIVIIVVAVRVGRKK